MFRSSLSRSAMCRGHAAEALLHALLLLCESDRGFCPPNRLRLAGNSLSPFSGNNGALAGEALRLSWGGARRSLVVAGAGDGRGGAGAEALRAHSGKAAECDCGAVGGTGRRNGSWRGCCGAATGRALPLCGFSSERLHTGGAPSRRATRFDSGPGLWDRLLVAGAPWCPWNSLESGRRGEASLCVHPGGGAGGAEPRTLGLASERGEAAGTVSGKNSLSEGARCPAAVLHCALGAHGSLCPAAPAAAAKALPGRPLILLPSP